MEIPPHQQSVVTTTVEPRAWGKYTSTNGWAKKTCS